jgi:hypothetical protein
MGYNALVSNNVRKAFNLLKDLADPAVLNKQSNVEFDFTTNVVTSNLSSVTTKIIITSVNLNSQEHNTHQKIGLLKTQEIGDISLYTTVTTGNKTWKLGPVIRTDKFVTIVELYE